MYCFVIKRAIDFSAALTVAVLLSPLIAVVAILIRIRLGSPVLFRQPRAGLNNQVFHVCKFRSMTDERDPDGNLLPDEVRLTSFGKTLRKLSLDELPQLWNVIRGDMSLIGPRPLLVRYLDRYSDEQIRRHEVRPGITGWAQVNGRNEIDWNKKFQLDVEYVDNCTFLMDVKIVLQTIVCLITRDGISASDHATMPEFMGNSSS
ncbi:MAG: sugar transferase [Planctomycetales bacterium]|nr:sugar transferase [Planctomycetales bacterium]